MEGVATSTTFRRTLVTWPKPGEWRRAIVDGRVTARLCCPSCHYQGTIEEHRIDADGRVTPSVDCPHCGYHETGVVLEGWAG